jgi:CRISPR system Cascade subunit CasD
VSTLLLLLTGPLQSWGERARFTDRDTLPHPTRSGIIGLIAAALGQARDADLDWATGLTVHVRADNPGVPLTDFHMVGSGYPRERAIVTADGKPRRNAHGQASGVVTNRHYLADAAFTAALSSSDTDLIDRLAIAVRAPRWPLFLGRKSCPPGHPVHLGVTGVDAETALASLPAYTALPRTNAAAGDWFTAIAEATDQVPTVERTVYLDGVDPAEAYTVTNDNPVTFDRTGRTYRPRHVGADLVRVPAAGIGVPGYQAIRSAIPTLTGASR